MTPSLQSHSTERHTAGAPQHLHGSEGVRTLASATEAHRPYRASTEGPGVRFHLPSHLTVRAGAQASPHERLLTFPAAGRAVGLPRSWGERQVGWISGQVSRIWGDKHERDEWREAVEPDAENQCNVADRPDTSPETARTRMPTELERFIQRECGINPDAIPAENKPEAVAA